MSTQTHCDRCDRNSAEKFCGYDQSTWMKIAVDTLMGNKTHDLCPVCAAEIKRWLSEHPPKVMPA